MKPRVISMHYIFAYSSVISIPRLPTPTVISYLTGKTLASRQHGALYL